MCEQLGEWVVMLGSFTVGGFVGVMLMAILSFASTPDIEIEIDEHEEMHK